MSDNDFSIDSMLELYLFEATGLLDQLDHILLQSESDNDLTDANINEIFRIMHTIKGSSAMMTFELISKVSHKTEDIFSIIRDSGVPKEKVGELFDLILKVSDFLKDEIKKIQEGSEPLAENKALVDEVQAMYDDISSLAPKKESNLDAGKMIGDISYPPKGQDIRTPEPVSHESQGPDLEANAETYFIHVYFNDGSKMENIRAFMLLNKMRKLGTINESIPANPEKDNSSADYIVENGFYFSFTTTLSREEIEDISKETLSVESVSFLKKMPNASQNGDVKDTGLSIEDITLQSRTDTDEEPESDPEESNELTEENILQEEELDMPQDAEATDEKDDASQVQTVTVKNHKTKQNLINVDLTKLDDLMDLVGELVTTKSMVTENPDIKNLKLDNFTKSARQLSKLTDELQDIVMSVRLVPVSSVFYRMRRVVRDMSKELDKDVELVLIGEDTEVDKTILDALSDPIMHLVRNAMDHAIEDKEDRIKAGKNATGQIILSAQNMGGDIIISISDDGLGLDSEEILDRAEAMNLLTKPKEEYSDKETFNILMTPGFSTKENVTKYSGRGVGLDVVNMNIKSIGGSVIIESVKNLGTNIFLKIPITLAIIECMEIKVGEEIYCLPINNIKESFKIGTGKHIVDSNNNDMIMLRGNVYPIIRLYEKYGIDNAKTDINEGILVLVDSGDKMACLLTDELIGKSQVVVKPIPHYLGEFNIKGSGISGCTIMGDGKISLILDVMEILS